MTGPTGHWSSDEDDALHELPWMAQLLYLRGLRRFMDASGVVGLSRRISRRGLMETLTVPGRRGRHVGEERTPTVAALRHALESLADAGLVVPLREGGKLLVFRLPLALQDQSGRRMSSRISNRMSNRRFFNGGKGFGALMDRVSSRMSAPHQSNNLPIDTLLPTDRPISRALDERIGDGVAVPTAIGALCRRLRQEAGMRDAHPHRPELLEAQADGLDNDLLVATAIELSQRTGPPNVRYLIATVRGRLRDSQQAPRPTTHAGNRRHPPSVCDRIQQQDDEATRREAGERGHLHVVK